MASGLIAGGAIAGVLQSVIAYFDKGDLFDLSGALGALAQDHSYFPMTMFLLMAGYLVWVGVRKEPGQTKAP